MAQINSTSNTNSTTAATSYTSKGFSGMVSGLDTEALVEAMTGDVQKKIDKVKQEQQTNTWKQDAYREVISALTSFQSKYFSYASSTNLLSSSFYNTTSMIAGGKNATAISIMGNTTTTVPSYSVSSIKSLASKASMTVAGDMSRANITTGAISFGDRVVCAAAGGSLAIKYGSSVYQVNISSDVTALTPESMATALNDAMKNVSLSTGNTLADKLTFTAADGKLTLGYTGEDSNGFSISGGTSTTLTALGFTTGAEPTSGKLTGAPVNLHGIASFSLAGKSLTLDLNGISKNLQFTNDDNTSLNAAIAGGKDKITALTELLQSKIDGAFGADKIKVNGDTVNSKLSFSTVKKNSSNVVEEDTTSVLKISSSSDFTLGVNGIFNMPNGISNRLDTTKKISELGLTPSASTYTINVNGQKFNFDQNTEIGTVLNTINSSEDAGVSISYLNTTGQFTITADASGAQGKLNIYDEQGGLAKALFGQDALYTPKVGTDPEVIAKNFKPGTDLEMTIRYTGSTGDLDIIRSTNTVSLDGVNFTAQSLFDATTTPADAITFTASSQPDKVVDAVKSMVTDYNSLVDLLAKYTETKKDSDYAPLTDAQKKKMTTDEITKWEAKAKEGLLFGDSTLSDLSNTLRFVFSATVSGVGEASSIGLSTASYYSDNGKITLDESKLKSALSTDPEKVKKIFTATAQDSASVTGSGYLAGGVITRLKTITEAYAKSTGSYKGKLVDLAGIKNNATTNDNYIARQQKILSAKLEDLQDLLKTRQTRYQSQFTKLESYISKMNSQSSWLSSASS